MIHPEPMKYDPERHHRRSVRLRGYDYSQAGAYFVTICTPDRACLFGGIADGVMRLNDAGRVVERCWHEITIHFPHVELDEFVIMPNHVHGVIVIVGAGLPRPYNTSCAGSPRSYIASGAETKTGAETKMGAETAPLRATLGQMVAYFKYQSTKHINIMRGTPGMPVWQRNYYEHIIRDDESLNRIREYIVNNPMQWALDRENPCIGGRGNPAPTGDESWRI